MAKATFGPVTNGSVTTHFVVDDPAYYVTETAFTHSVPKGKNQILIVTSTTAGAPEDVSMTYGGIPMTRGRSHGAGDYVYYSYWYLLNPPTGLHEIAATFPLSGGRHYAAITMSNVDQQVPFDEDAHISGTASNPSLTVTTTKKNATVLYFLALGGYGISFTPTDPTLYTVSTGYSNTGAMRQASSPGSVTVGGSITGSGFVWEFIAVPIRSAR
jgi:hypothetical protein